MTRLTTSHLAMLAPALLLAACGGAPQAPTSAEAAQAPVAEAKPQAAEAAAANALTLAIGATRHALRSDSGSALRSPVYGVDGVETLIIEVLNSDNTLYAKADLYVAPGGAVDGEYVLGHLGDPAIRNQPGHGQVMVAVEQDGDRWIAASGNGSLSVTRNASGLTASFAFDRNGLPMGADIEPISGELQVGAGKIGF